MSICDASSSWSGYQYQGKVSIYIVLKMINDFIEDEEDEEYKNYSIEIEHREDFSIKYKGNYKSIHQVKARIGDTTINPYLEAMRKLNEDKLALPSLNLYLHTICSITDWSLDGYRKCLNTKVENLNNKLKKCEKEDEKIKKEIVYLTNILEDESFFNNIKLYQYSEGNYHCSLDEIKDLIKKEIQRYLELTNKNYKLGNVEIIYNQFIGYLDEYIKERHKKNVKVDIEFKEFKEILDKDDTLERDENYYLHKTKERYIYNINRYCEKICSRSNICDKNIKSCRLIKVVQLIEDINLDDFKKLIYKINPHVKISDWERDNNELVDPSDIYFLCHVINDEIQLSYNIYNNTLLYKKDMNSYMPTTIRNIDEFMIHMLAEEYIRNIKNNDFLLNELFESNIFITGNLNKENILEDICDVEEVDEDKKSRDRDLEDKQYLKNRVDFKEIKLVKEELN